MMWEHLSILLSKRPNPRAAKRIRCVGSIACFLAVVIGLTRWMDAVYVDDTDEFARYALHEFYGQKENIDRLYLGSSHVFCGINPTVLDQINKDNNFNLSTGTQQLITSYYLLKEADKRHELEHVYVDLYYDLMTAGLGNFHAELNLPYSWIVIDQMKMSANKLDYIFHLSEPNYYYMSFFKFTQFKDKLFDMDYIKDIAEKKQTQRYKDHQYYHEIAGDAGRVMRSGDKGFMECDVYLEDGGYYELQREEANEENSLTEESKEYLLKIVDYCKEHNIELTFISCPVSEFQLTEDGHYDDFTRQISELAGQYDFRYYDFNLCKQEYLYLPKEKYWMDKGHLNTEGAAVFSDFLGRFLLAEEAGEDSYQDCFYGSYEEKLLALPEEIFGMEIIKTEENEENCTYELHPVTNVREGRIEIDAYIVQDDGENNQKSIPVEVERAGNDGTVILPSLRTGPLRVEMKLQGAEKANNWVEIEY